MMVLAAAFSFAEKMMSALRYGFGGHKEKSVVEKRGA